MQPITGLDTWSEAWRVYTEVCTSYKPERHRNYSSIRVLSHALVGISNHMYGYNTMLSLDLN